jgi:hypothetical protein
MNSGSAPAGLPRPRSACRCSRRGGRDGCRPRSKTARRAGSARRYPCSGCGGPTPDKPVPTLVEEVHDLGSRGVELPGAPMSSHVGNTTCGESPSRLQADERLLGNGRPLLRNRARPPPLLGSGPVAVEAGGHVARTAGCDRADDRLRQQCPSLRRRVDVTTDGRGRQLDQQPGCAGAPACRHRGRFPGVEA